jgi:hypothetical protein
VLGSVGDFVAAARWVLTEQEEGEVGFGPARRGLLLLVWVGW